MTFYFYVWLYPPRFLELYLLKEAKKEVKSLSITHKKKKKPQWKLESNIHLLRRQLSHYEC